MSMVNLALISAALFGWVLGSEADEIAIRDLFVFIAALAIILTVQLSLLYRLDQFIEGTAPGRNERIRLVVTSVVLACNAYFLAFMTLDQPTGIRVACAVSAGVAFFVLMSIPRARPVLALFAGAMLIMSLVQYASARMVFRGKDVSGETVTLPVKSKRNVYIIGFESLQSPAAYRENYDLEDVEHVKVLRDAGFRVLDDAFSAEQSTLRSYANIFEFVRPVRGDDLGNRTAFINDNSTFRSFRDSGYGIQFIYTSNYFAVNRNNVDYVYPPLTFDACENLEPMYFYGLCFDRTVRTINKYILRSPRVSYKREMAHLRERTDFADKSQRPWLTFTHIRFPFHTYHYMRHPDPEYAAEFKRRVHRAMPTIAENLKNSAGYVAAKDPDAVVIVLGDHGTHLFRGVRKEQMYSSTPILPLEKVLLDQNGVMFAVYPAGFCTNRMAEGFSTKALVENLIACLNGDDSPTDEERRRARMIRFLNELQDVGELRAKALTQSQKN